MSLLDKYTAKYGNQSRVNQLRKQKDWVPEAPTNDVKASNIAAAHQYMDSLTDEDKKRITSNGLGNSLGMQLNGPLNLNIGLGKNAAKESKEYQTYTAAEDIIKAENYEQKRESIVRGYGKQAYDTMKNYLSAKAEADKRLTANPLMMLSLSKERNEYKAQADKQKEILEKLGIKGKDFDKYAQYVQEYMDIEATQAREKDIKRVVQGHPVAGGAALTAADVLASPASGFLATGEAIKSLGYADREAPINAYSNLYGLLNASNAVEQSVIDEIDSKLGKWAYSAGVSTAKSAEAMAIAGGLGKVLGFDAASKLGQLATLPTFGTQAFASTVKDAQDRGFTAEKAIEKGLASGMAEMLFEELSLDKAWGTLRSAQAGKGGFKKRVIDVLMGAGIEGSEEIFTDIANFISDGFINGDYSDYQTEVRMAVENGMSLNDATKQAKLNFLTQLIEDGVAGAFSGGVMNVGAATIGSIQYHNTARNINENSKLKTEVVESAKGLDGTTAAEIANSKPVEEINENDMVEILHSMEEVTQKSAHDIAKESLMNAGETEEEAEKKAQAIVVMASQTAPTEAEEKANIDLVADENAANAYVGVLKNRVAGNVLADVEEHNAEVKKIKDRVKGKNGITAGYNGQEIKVYDFEDVQKGIVATSQGLLDLSEITLPDDMRLLFKNAHALENTKAANAFIEGYKGQSPSYYATGSLRAFMVGASGGSWESFINSKNPLNIKLIEEIGDNAYLKSMYFYGQNSRESSEVKQIDTSKINPGNVTGENELNPILEPIARVFNVSIETNSKRGQGAGSFTPSKLLIQLSAAESNNLVNTVVHEVNELSEAFAPKEYNALFGAFSDLMRETIGDTEFKRNVELYKSTYRAFGKRSGDTKEANKTFEQAAKEYFNDFMAGIVMTERGTEFFGEYIAKNDNMTAEQKVDALTAIKNFIKRFIDTIKAYLSGNRGKNIGTKDAEILSQYKDKLETILKSYEAMLDAARAEISRQINGEKEVEKAVKEVTEDYTETEHKQFSLNTDVESTKHLMAVHNVSEERLLKTLKLGGFACPSIAVKLDYIPHSDYGENTVVFAKATIDPQWNKENNVYSGDAWTPVFPTVDKKISRDTQEKIENRVIELVGGKDIYNILGNANLDYDNMTDKLNRNETPADAYGRDKILKYAYLQDTGKGFAVPTKEKQYISDLTNDALGALAIKLGENTLNEMNDGGYRYYESHPELVDSIRLDLNEAYIREHQKEINDLDSGDGFRSKRLRDFFYNRFNDEDGKLSWRDYEKIMRAMLAIRRGSETITDTQEFEKMLGERVDQKAFESWVNNLFDGVVEKEGIRNDVDMFTPSGTRRSWDALHFAVTLENVVKHMKKQDQQGAGNALIGPSEIWGVSTRKYKSVKEMRQDIGRLIHQTEEERQELRDKLAGRMTEIAKSIKGTSQYGDLGAMNTAGEAIVDSLRGAKTIQSINKRLAEWPGLHIKDNTAADILDLYNDILHAPTDYFEAKPTRAVGLNEIAYVVIPDNASERLVKALNDNGITYKTYEAENEEDRLKVVQENASEESDTVFSINVIDGDNGKNYGKGVYLDSTLLTNLTDSERKEMVKERIDELGDQSFTAFDKNGNPVDIRIEKNKRRFKNAKGKIVPVNKDLITKYNANPIKQESIVLANELIETSAFDKPSAADKSHGWLDNNGINNWEYWNTYVVDRDGNIWKATLNVTNASTGEKILYDIDPIRPIKEKGRPVKSVQTLSKKTIPQNNKQSNNKSHSLNVDSQGSSLTSEQAEFFKDSKARDDEGRLLVMYHGTDAYKDFTVFKPGKNGYLGKGMYFTEKKYIAEKYAEQNGYEGRVYQVYLNIKNPLVVTSDNPALEILGEKVAAKRAEKNSYSTRWLTPADINKLKAKGYDGIIWKYGKSPIEISVWDPNQVKNTDNLKPTENEDIRYSLNVDSEGKELTEAQEKYFAESKIRDAEGRLLRVYHGTSHGGFTEFKNDLNYFTANRKYAERYTRASSNGKVGQVPKVYEGYLNITKPFDITDPEAKRVYIEEYIKGGYAQGISPYASDDEINKYAENIDWTEADNLKEFLDENDYDYDGIILNEGGDITETGTVMRGNSYVTFDSNQFKNVDNLNPTESRDIRYSLDVEDWEKDFFAEMTGNANVSNILTEGLKSLDNIKLNKKITDKIAREVREEYKSRIKVADLSDSLEKVFSYMLDTGAPSYGDLVNIMKEVAMPVVEQATEIMPEEKRIWDDFKEKMKGYRIKLNPQQKAEVANTFGTYYAFKNDMFGNLIFSESGTELDSIWTEICDASGGFLDYAENPANQPMALYEFVEALKPTPANIYGADQEEAAYDVALTIFRKFLVEQEYENNPKLRKEALKLTEAQQTYKKRIKENYDKKFKEATESLRREKEINMKRLATEIKYLNEEEKAAIEGSIEQALILRQKRQYEWRLQKLRETKNDEINRKLSELKARQRASISRRVEGRQLTLAKARIRKNVEKLNSMLAHGTENRHIPKNMVLSTIAMLESIDINTGNSKGMAEYLQKMEDIYRGFKDSDVYTDGEKAASFDYDERTAANIEALRKLFDGRNYTQLSLSELQQVIDITNAVITQAENANKLLGKAKREYATDFARTAAQEVRNAKAIDNRFMTNLDHYFTNHLNAYREFRKLSGYEDGKLMELYYDLDKGQQKQLQVMKDINAIFDDVLSNQKEVKRLTSTKKEDLVDSGLKDDKGNPVMITRAERLSLIMHSYNKSNMQHLLYGGISVPDLSYKDPKQQRAHAQTYFYESQMEVRNAILDKNANKLDLIEQRATMKVKELEKQLSPWEKQFLEATKEMFWKTTGRLINETSLELKGYTLARVANYFPIKTDTDYTKSDVSGLVFDGTIEGMGFLKERRFGRNAMMLEDITDTILRQTQSVAKYVGLAIPVRNFNMVWNAVTRSPMGNADTLKKAISVTWGAKNTDYIVNLMKDLNGRRDGGEPSGFDELRGRFAGAVLTLNPSVAIKQAASYFTAAAKVGNLTLAKTLKDLGKGFILKKGIPELEAINPLLWYRNQGNATQELADMKAVGFGKNLPIWAQKALNWVQFMDTGTVRTLEYAAKNYVDAEYKGPKNAEYWQRVSDVFTSIVEETQPNYTVLQQADIIRNPNKALKMLVMFKTQPLQNFGTVYDAIGEYAAKVKKGNKAQIQEAGKHLAWALSSQIASAITFSAMAILADMILHKQYKYKDDDDKFSWLNVLAKFGAGVRDCFLGAMLAGQEAYAALNYLFNKLILGKQSTYYGLEVSFLGEIKDIVESIGKLGEESVKRINAVTEADRDKYNKGILIDISNVVSYLGQLTGVPLGNIKNMGQSLILYAIDISNGTIGEAELSREVPNQYERMYDALQNKDSERYNTLFDEMVTKKMRDSAEDGKEKDQEDIEKSVETSAKKYIKDGYNSGELTYDEAYTILTKEFGMEEDDAYFKLDEWLYKSEGHEDYTRYIRLADAVNGQGDIQAEIDKLTAQGIEADTIKTQLTGILRDGYNKNTLSKEKITGILTEYEGLNENDVYYKFKEWDFKKTHPDESFSKYDAMNSAIKEVINGSDNRKPMIAEIEDLMKHGVEAKSLQSQLTKEYKPLYLELMSKGKASTLKNVLIAAYMATGLSRDDAIKRIDNWK